MLLFDLRREALEPERFDALIHLVQGDLGFHLYRSVEQAKLALSNDDDTRFAFADEPVQIEQRVERSAFETWIDGEVAAIEGCLDDLLERADVGVAAVDRVFMTGGSSFVPAVRGLFERRFGAERIRAGGELTSVASGLALRARELN